MQKNLLSDTSYTKGQDNRFGITGAFGKVSKLEVTKDHANVRVIMRDRVDHKNNPMISKPIPVLQIASQAKKSFAMPRVDDVVCMIKLPNGTGNYAVIGSFFTKSNPPPVTDPMLDHTLYDDGSIKEFDANKGNENWTLKGDVNWNNQGGASLQLQKDYSLVVQGDITLQASGKIILKGDIQHTGNMSTSGIHNAADGPHAACGLTTAEELERKIAMLTERVAELERRLAA